VIKQEKKVNEDIKAEDQGKAIIKD
jgi:hypothetical protein